MRAPLEGIRILDLSRFISGPYCGMLLGDFGADVVKVEKAGRGDDTRGLSPFIENESLYTFAMNRNKRSLELNFRSKEGKKLLFDLAVKSDILIENFKVGTMDKMGCDWETLHKANPALIMISITGFGAEGPYKDKPGFDAAIQAMSGLMSITGDPDAMPMMSGTYNVDYAAAMYATIAVLSALIARGKTGEGQHIELSLLDCAATLLLAAIPLQTAARITTERIGNRDRYLAPGNCFKTADGSFLMIVAGGDSHFKILAEVMNKEYLLKDPRFINQDVRFNNAGDIEEIVAEWVAQYDIDELRNLLDKAGLVSAKVETIKDVVENPQLLYRKKLIKVNHPIMGEMMMMGAPYDFSGMELDLTRAAPTLGQHNEEVLTEWLGAEENNIRFWKENKII
jgi:crotonobetainyl-CoA:carnitine CoA-transferase CaiB-like acyl-CoA transferase